MTLPSVDVVVVSYNSEQHLRGCVGPLASDAALHVVVVDNNSTDHSVRSISDLPIALISMAENVGFGAACNAGWRSGDAELVLFLNPDTRMSSESIRRMAERHRELHAGILAPRVVNELGGLEWSLRRFPTIRSILGQALFLHRLVPRARWVDEVVRDQSVYGFEHACEWASGACLMVRRELLERLSGFDEEFFMYCEDVDLCRRAQSVGESTIFTPAGVCVHVGGASAPRAALVPTLARSRIIYARKHFARPRAAVYRGGVVLNALTHAVAAKTRAAREGHRRALRVALARTVYERS